MSDGRSVRRPRPSPSPWDDPGDGGRNLALEDFPSFLFTRLASAMQRDVTAAYLAEFDIAAPQWRILAALAAYSPIPFGDLVKLSMADKALVSRSVQAIAARGWAEVTADPDHGRKLVCTVTPAGRALYRRILPKAQAAQAGILSLLTREERTALHAALVKLRQSLEARQPPAA